MNALLALVMLRCVLQTCLVTPTRADGFNTYKDALRGRNDDEVDAGLETDPAAQTELLSKIIRYYRTPLHILDDGGVAVAGSDSAAADVISQFKKRTVSKFKSAFLYYLTHDLAHLQNILLFDEWLAKRARLLAHRNRQQQEQEKSMPHTGKDVLRAVYIPRALA